MNRTLWTALGIAVLAAIGAYLYFRSVTAPQPLEAPPVAATAPVPATPAPEAEQHYPLPEAAPAPAAAPPPSLDNSDGAILQALQQLLGPAAGALLTSKDVVRRIVATVDSLDRAPIPPRQRALAALPGALVVDAGATPTLSARNFVRYEVLVSALRATDGSHIAAVYREHYALFQQAYEDLGYPGRYFNDRLVRVIDHLLATPEVPPPLGLVASGGIYKFADPALEARSSGQKALIRIGPENAAVVKARLRELRQAITAGAAPRP
jgi:hypothetical protein